MPNDDGGVVLEIRLVRRAIESMLKKHASVSMDMGSMHPKMDARGGGNGRVGSD